MGKWSFSYFFQGSFLSLALNKATDNSISNLR